MTVRPFGRDYRQNQQGGGGGGGGGGQDPGALTQQQRDIVAATFKAERDKREDAGDDVPRKRDDDSPRPGSLARAGG